MTESSLQPGEGFVAETRCGSGGTLRITNGDDRHETAGWSRSTMTHELGIAPVIQ
jgi:hypothetical protein